MRYSCCLTRRTCVSAVLAFFLAVVAATGSRPASAQPGAGDTPLTYEVQIDGESFEVEGGRPPIKVESKLKKGTTYTLALRVAMTQPLRLNSVQLEYGMSAKVADDKGKDLRIAQIDHEIGFSLEITDLGQALDAKHQDELLKTIADAAVKRFTDSKATGLKRAEPKAGKIWSLRGQVVGDQLQRLRRRGLLLFGFRAFGREIYCRRGGPVPGARPRERASLGAERLAINSTAAAVAWTGVGPATGKYAAHHQSPTKGPNVPRSASDDV